MTTFKPVDSLITITEPDSAAAEAEKETEQQTA